MSWFKKIAQAVDLQKDIQDFISSNLEVDDYGIEFILISNEQPISEQEAASQISNVLVTMPSVSGYLFKLLERDLPAGKMPVISVDYDKSFNQLNLYYNGQQISSGHLLEDGLSYKGLKIKEPPRTVGGRKKQLQRLREQKEQEGNVLETPDETYLFHANHCGYLMAKTIIRKVVPPWTGPNSGRYGKGMEAWIRMPIDELVRLYDRFGGQPLKALLSGERTIDEKEGITRIYSIPFVREVLEFLGLVVDLPDTLDPDTGERGETFQDDRTRLTQFADRILHTLVSQRPDLNSEEIEYYFKEGAQGQLVW